MIPGKIDINGVADILGYCVGHCRVITRRREFPKPSLFVGRTKFWQREDVTTFAHFLRMRRGDQS